MLASGIDDPPNRVIQENKTLAHFILALSFAKPRELGWDPTMIRLRAKKGQPAQYDITVHDVTGETIVYRTIRLISDVKCESTLGPGTRLWEARKLQDGKMVGHQGCRQLCSDVV